MIWKAEKEKTGEKGRKMTQIEYITEVVIHNWSRNIQKSQLDGLQGGPWAAPPGDHKFFIQCSGHQHSPESLSPKNNRTNK